MRCRTVSPCSVFALTQLLLLWECLALTFKQLREQAVSLELPQEKLMGFLSPVPPCCSPCSHHRGPSGDSPQAAVCCSGSWGQPWERVQAGCRGEAPGREARSPFSAVLRLRC